MKFEALPLTKKLLWSIGLTMAVTLLVSSAWLFHEVRELMERFVQRAVSDPEKIFEHSEREVFVAIFIPSLIAFSASLFISYLSIRRIVSPLLHLAKHLNEQNVSHLKLFDCQVQTYEIQTISKAFNELIQKMELAFRREKQFTADVSHELRTPIAGIRLHLELLKQDSPNEVEPLIQRLDDMQHSIDQLLTLARIEQRLVTGILTEIDLINEVIRPSLKEFQEILESAQISLVIDVPDVVLLKGEPILLRLLLRNLIENSSRYAHSHSRLEIKVIQVERGVMILLQDEGDGVLNDELQNITQAFKRFDQRGKGVGLGLNIVARIAQIHDAELNIANREDTSGLRVQITFSEK